MRIEKINTKMFLENLEIVGNVIPSKSAIQALTSIYLKFEDNKITMLGSNNETSIKKILIQNNEDKSFNIIENGTCLVDYKTLKAILSKLNSNLSVFYTEDNQFVIESGKSVFRLNLVDEKEYPKIEFKKLENEIIIKNEELKKIIKKTSFACATSENRPILTGVNFNICKENDNYNAFCVSTDSFRLSKYQIDIENFVCNNENVNFTISKLSLIALEKIISKTNEEFISILFDTNNDVLINVDNTLFKTRLLEGTYPNTNNILNFEAKGKVEVSRDLLQNAIDRISVFSNESGMVIAKLVFDKNNLTVMSDNTQIGNGKESVVCECDTNLQLCCDSNYLLEALKVFDDEKVVINLKNEIQPFTIQSENDNKLTQLILPIRNRE